MSPFVFHQFREELKYYNSDPVDEHIPERYGITYEQALADALINITWFTLFLKCDDEFIPKFISQ